MMNLRTFNTEVEGTRNAISQNNTFTQKEVKNRKKKQCYRSKTSLRDEEGQLGTNIEDTVLGQS